MPISSSSTLLLDRVGEVDLSIDPDGISWKPVNDESNASFCLRKMPSLESEIKFAEVYAVEFIGWGFIHDVVWDAGLFHSINNSEMYRFVVHGLRRKKTCNSPWVLCAYTFGHKDLQTCQTWVGELHNCIKKEVGRPKNLLIFVHPLCGKGNGLKIWETVTPLFARAKVKTTVNVTTRAGHAYDLIKTLTNEELCSLDGIITVGGDGLFNEVLNGLLPSRHNFPYPPAPAEHNSAGNNDEHRQCRNSCSSNGRDSINISGILSEHLPKSDDREPLLSTSESSRLNFPVVKIEHRSEDTDKGKDISFSFPNDWFRLGIIPAGSTDAIVISTTGVRDPVTSALHIILGKKVSLDIAQVVRWKTSPSSMDLPSVRYAASFAGYGFYGDVIKESEKYRWMGPKRYDYAGTKVFLEHRSYEAEIAYLEDKTADPVTTTNNSEIRKWPSLVSRKNSTKVICRMNCDICQGTAKSKEIADTSITNPIPGTQDASWLRSKGHFLSVGAAVISCRNERAPDGLVADAHLADGFLHLILIKDCPRPLYLWHLTQLTRKGGDPLKYKFVEHHKTRAFTFVSNHDKSLWNLDGELFQACQVSVQACRGLVNLFASGPEV